VKFSFHPAAEIELNQAVDYYESCAKGLGIDFALEIHDTIKRIIAHPAAWAILSGAVRRCQTKRSVIPPDYLPRLFIPLNR
jgi:hypothetical protein